MRGKAATLAHTSQWDLFCPFGVACRGFSPHHALSPLSPPQAQRDFFGSHTYQRTDAEGWFHTVCGGVGGGGGGLGGGGGRRIPHTSGGGKHMQMAFPFTPLCRRYSSLMLFPPALHCSGLGRLLWQCGLHHHQPVQRLEEGFGLLWLVLRMYDFITASHQSLEEPCERGIWMNGCCRRSNVDGCGLASWKDPGLFICD